MDRGVGEVVSFGVVARVAVGTSPQLLDVVSGNAAVVVVVVQSSCSCGVVHLM